MIDYILNGQAFGQVADRLLSVGGDPNVLRPFSGKNGRGTYININQGGKTKTKLITNAPATLRRDDWVLIDQAVVRSAQPRLRAWADLVASGNVVRIPNGMGKTVLTYPRMGNITPATVSMDGRRESERDRPLTDLDGVPLPIIHKDFQFGLREVLVSRNDGMPLDTTTAELAARRVAEEAEKMTIGLSSYSFGGYTVYGYANAPSRKTKVLTNPAGWASPKVFVDETLDMIALAAADNQHGPWIMYVSPAYQKYLDSDYATGYPRTLRSRVSEVEGITAIRQLDYLTGFQVLMVHLTSEVARAIIGMDIRTLQWESSGGMSLNFKVMAILVPQIRSTFEGDTDIIHGTAP